VVINLFNFFRHYKFPPFHFLILIHLISLSYHISVVLPSHFSSMEQMLMLMFCKRIADLKLTCENQITDLSLALTIYLWHTRNTSHWLKLYGYVTLVLLLKLTTFLIEIRYYGFKLHDWRYVQIFWDTNRGKRKSGRGDNFTLFSLNTCISYGTWIIVDLFCELILNWIHLLCNILT